MKKKKPDRNSITYVCGYLMKKFLEKLTEIIKCLFVGMYL